MLKNNDYQKAVELINKSHNVLITTHTRADGDAAGCCAALNEALTALGKNAQMVFLSTLPQWYSFLFDKKVPVLGQDVTPEQLSAGSLGKFDLIIIVDTNSYSQLPKIDAYLKIKPAPILVIDHHATSDQLGSVEMVDTKAAAACLVVLGLLKFANWPVTGKIAEALFAGIATDTGWFHFNNTDAGVLRTCAELVEAGANPPKIHRHVYSSYSIERFRLMTAMQNSLELYFNGRLAIQTIRQQDFKNTGAKYEDTESLIDECHRIATVEAAALFVELADGRIRCSLRSNGNIDVCKIAAKFDGGGHTAAAGTYLPSPLENAKKLILSSFESQLNH